MALSTAKYIEMLEHENAEFKQLVGDVPKLRFELESQQDQIKTVVNKQEALIQTQRALIASQKDLIQKQEATIKALEARVKDLEARLAKNSQNSNKPSSQDGYKKPNPKSERGKSGKTSGGQPGHQGHTLKQVEHPDHIERHAVGVCCAECQCSLEGIAATIETRQEFEIPPLKVTVTEHQVEVKKCKKCGHVNKADAPISAPAQYGKCVEALAVYLTQYQFLPLNRTREFFADLLGLHLSEGTLVNMTRRCHIELAGFESTVKEALIKAKLAHFDESGLKVKKLLQWLHVACTSKLTCYHLDLKRGSKAMNRMGILPNFTGTAVHDNFKSYYDEAYKCAHSLCNAHHLRELRFHEEEYQQIWCGEMRSLLLTMRKSVEDHLSRGETALPQQLYESFKEHYFNLLMKALDEIPKMPAREPGKKGKQKNHSAYNLWSRLINQRDEALAFLKDFTIPFTNNQAERDIRMIKTKQKVSGCFRSDEGGKMFCRIRGFISTARKQGHNIFDALIDACKGTPFIPVH